MARPAFFPRQGDRSQAWPANVAGTGGRHKQAKWLKPLGGLLSGLHATWRPPEHENRGVRISRKDAETRGMRGSRPGLMKPSLTGQIAAPHDA